METQTLVNLATIGSPIVTLVLTGIGWLLISLESKKASARAETYDLLNNIVKTSLALNKRSAEFFLENKHSEGTHRAWVASVSVDVSSLRALAGILKELHSITVPDDFFYAVRKTYTLDAEYYSTYDLDQKIQKISDQNTKTSKAIKLIYGLYPAKNKRDKGPQ